MDESLLNFIEDTEEIEQRQKSTEWKIREVAMHWLFRVF